MQKRTKIVATVGPASNTYDKLLSLAKTGVDVFRVNFSHGTQEEHAEVVKHIKRINEENGFTKAILQDLQGPKIRIGELKDGKLELKKDQDIYITTGNILGDEDMISTSYQAFVSDVEVGDNILIDDGNLHLQAIAKEENRIKAKVIFGGTLKPKKGINLPNSNISSPALTEKDHEDLLFGLEQGVHWVALSFVRNKEDLEQVKRIIAEKHGHARVIAKIERPEALVNMDDIINTADGIMVARGDLAVEIEMSDVPVIQKNFIERCKEKAIPVIVATQMMESMIDKPRPTRAEVNDVANAVVDGADAVMLSAESATGKFPVETVACMVDIVKNIESKWKKLYNHFYDFPAPHSDSEASDVVMQLSTRMSKSMRAKAIVATSFSGSAAFKIARHRPKGCVYVFTPRKYMVYTLNLLWGVQAFHYDPKENSSDKVLEGIINILKENELVESGDTVINTISIPIYSRGKTNTIRYFQI